MWACGAVLHAAGPDGGSLGEAWGKPSGVVSLLGFALLVIGTVLYAQVSATCPASALDAPVLPSLLLLSALMTKSSCSILLEA